VTVQSNARLLNIFTKILCVVNLPLNSQLKENVYIINCFNNIAIVTTSLFPNKIGAAVVMIVW